jgi:hypothetical protein
VLVRALFGEINLDAASRDVCKLPLQLCPWISAASKRAHPFFLHYLLQPVMSSAPINMAGICHAQSRGG